MSSQSENIETEAQKQADIQKLTAVFVVIVAFFQNIFKKINLIIYIHLIFLVNVSNLKFFKFKIIS